MEYYSARKQETLPFVITRRSLEDFMLSDINQTPKDKDFMISIICDIKNDRLIGTEEWWLPGVRVWRPEGMGKWWSKCPNFHLED